MLYLIDSDLSPFTIYTSEIHCSRHVRRRKYAASRWLRPLTLMTPGRKVVRNKYTTFCKMQVTWIFGRRLNVHSWKIKFKTAVSETFVSPVVVFDSTSATFRACSCGASELAKDRERVEKRLHLIMKSIQIMCLWPLYTQSKLVKPVS